MAICAPVVTLWHGPPTQVSVNTAEGLKHESAIQCDGLMSLEKSRLTDYAGELASDKLRELDGALLAALRFPTAAQTPIAGAVRPQDKKPWESRRFPANFGCDMEVYYLIISMYYMVLIYLTSIIAKAATISHFESAGRPRAVVLGVSFQDSDARCDSHFKQAALPA